MYNSLIKYLGVFILKKSLIFILVAALAVSAVFASCSKNKENDNSTGGLNSPGAEYGIEKDENGKDVEVIYEKDDDGNVNGYIVEDGKKTDVTVPSVDNYVDPNETTKYTDNEIENNTKPDPKDDEDITNNTSDEKDTTNPELTTLPLDKAKLPKTTDSGTPVKFSDKDIVTVTKMLQVPYLYTASYESNEDIPIEIARHVAIWNAQNDGNKLTTFPSGTVVSGLFVYFQGTVRNFSTSCNTTTNDSHPAPIAYNVSKDTFTISSYESKTHSIDIKSIEFLGNNNYYKVLATVKEENKSGCDKRVLVAIIQKNKLNSNYKYSFSVKALQWK